MPGAPGPARCFADRGSRSDAPLARLRGATVRRPPAVNGRGGAATRGPARLTLRRAAICWAGGLTFGLFLSGCSTPNGLPDLSLFSGTAPPEKAPESAEVATCATPQACAAELKQLVSSPKRDWIGKPQSADAYANGTRLFAYRALRKKLSCGELKGALADTSAAASLLGSPRHDRARALTTAVSHELKLEQDRRCRPRGRALATTPAR
jgi:hypothetical protein